MPYIIQNSSRTPIHSVELNADVGESWYENRIGDDASLMPYLDACNIACGMHAGDALTIQATIDLALHHGDGSVQIADRSKDIIISGGENVSSVEVEGALMAHPDVSLAAVVAMPDETWGEVPCAFVELRDEARVTEAELIAFARARLAGFKTPKKVIFAELPKTSTGKIQKFELRKRFDDG